MHNLSASLFARSSGWILVAALCAALAGGPAAQAADPSEFSVAERRLFTENHFRTLGRGAAVLDYTFEKRGTLEANADDRAVVTVGAADTEGGRPVKVQFLSGPRKLELPGVEHAEGNPVILFFLEREVREMNRLTRGSTNYYRKRIRMALAAEARVESTTATVGGRTVSVTEIHIAPYRNDPARSRYERFAEKTYVFVLSDEVPGEVVELRGVLRGPGAAAAPVLSESLRFAGQR
jgi:hypothetical protein